MKEWTDDFNALSGGEDFITKEDLEKYWQRGNKNPSKEDVNVVCKSLSLTDKDGETKIGLKEFIDIQTAAEKASFFTNDSQAELIEALKCFDGSNDNTISKDDLRGILSEYDDTVIDDVFKAVGVNDDGKLSIRELAMLLTSTVKK